MPKQVKFVAATAMDDYYQNYATPTDFFTLEDFIVRVGNVAGDFYRAEWKKMYDELRVERIQEIVGFDPTSLSEQFTVVEKKGSEWVGTIAKQAMSFPFDMQTSGYQNIFDKKTGKELERSNINETWTYQYQPVNDRFFYRIERNQIKIFTRGNCNIQEVRILYVPSIKIGDGEEWLPDGIVGVVIAATVTAMREMAGRPIKKSLDGNQNISMETEMNKAQLK